MLTMLVAMTLLELTGPDRQIIEINPANIVSMRVPRRSEHFAPGTRCIIFTSDGKQTTVQEACRTIADMLHRNGYNGR